MQNEIEQKIYSIIKARTSFTDSFSLELTNEIAAAIAPLVEAGEPDWKDSNIEKPKENMYVLVKTPFCKSKYSVALWNGTAWKLADDKTNVLNVEYWRYL